MNGQKLAYVRVSSTDQNLERQLQAIREAVRNEPDRWFEDRVSGGSKSGRTGLLALQQHYREGDEVYVASMDRLARNTADLLGLVDDALEKGVAVRFVKESLSFVPGSADATGRLLLTVMGAVAEMERALIRERQAEGIALAKKRDVYRKGPRLTPEQVTDARERCKLGVPVSRVAKDLGVSRQTIYNALNGEGVYADLALAPQGTKS